MRNIVGLLVALVVGCGVSQEGDVSIYYGYGGDPGAGGSTVTGDDSGGSTSTGGAMSYGGDPSGVALDTGGSIASTGGDTNASGGIGSGVSEPDAAGGAIEPTCGPCHYESPYCLGDECVQCLSDKHCPSDDDVCNVETGACVFHCQTDEHCPDGERCLDGACGECSDDSHCQEPGIGFCNEGRCSQCHRGDEMVCSGFVAFQCETELDLVISMCNKPPEFSCGGTEATTQCDGVSVCTESWGECLAPDGRTAL